MLPAKAYLFVCLLCCRSSSELSPDCLEVMAFALCCFHCLVLFYNMVETKNPLAPSACNIGLLSPNYRLVENNNFLYNRSLKCFCETIWTVADDIM